MPKTLYISDLDGTLLDADATLSAENACRLSALTARGALVTCATARTPGTVQPLMAPAQLSAPAIVMTGAALWTIDSPRPCFCDVHYIPANEALTLDECFARAGVTPFIYAIDPGNEAVPITFHFAGSDMSDAQKAFADQRSRLRLKRFVQGGRPPATDRRPLYFAIGPRQSIVPLSEEIARSCSCAMSVYPDNYVPDLYLLEIFAPGVSKATAVKALATKLGATRTVVFGDNLNDLPMMSVADLSVAAPGALGQVKEAADIVLEASPTAVADFMTRDFAGTLK